MALATYSDLKTAIANYLARSDLTNVIPDFITQAESRMNRKLRTFDMEVSQSVTMSSGVGTLPTDYLEWISVTWTSTDSRNQDLRYVSPNSEEWRLRYRPNADPSMFTILASQIKLRPVSSGNITFYYYQKIATLNTTNTTNWLLTKAPDLYVNYALAEAAIYLKDEEKKNAFLQLADTQADRLVMEADTNKVARRPSQMAETTEISAARNEATRGIEWLSFRLPNIGPLGRSFR